MLMSGQVRKFCPCLSSAHRSLCKNMRCLGVCHLYKVMLERKNTSLVGVVDCMDFIFYENVISYSIKQLLYSFKKTAVFVK